jgi:hypothetical protein
MAIEMKLEIDGRMTREQAELAFLTSGFDACEAESDGALSTFHPKAGLSAWLTRKEDPSPPLAEGMLAPPWLCRWLITFRYATDSFDASHLATMRFASELARISSAHFVLSFQYEGVYGLRDRRGFRSIPDPDATMRNPIG